jgi:hypothetical protein
MIMEVVNEYQNEFMEIYFNMWPVRDVLMKVVNNEGKVIL